MEPLTAKMRLGIQPTGWTNDDFPEIGDDTPYQVILDQTRQAGFQGGSTGHNYPTHLPSLLQALSSRQLSIVSTWFGTSFSAGIKLDDPVNGLKEFKTQLDFLKNVGATDVVVAELANSVNLNRTKSVLQDRPILNTAQWQLFTRQLDEAGALARDSGMQLSYHPHVGTCVQTLEETELLLTSTSAENVALCLDTAHLRYGGASQHAIEGLTEKFVARIKHVHLKNVRQDVLQMAVRKNCSFYDAVQHGIFTVPGDPAGDLDLRPILQILQRGKYDRWLVVEAEQNPKNANPLQAAHTARAFLRSELGY